MAKSFPRSAAGGHHYARASAARTSLRTMWAVLGVDFVVFGAVFPILPLFAHHLGLSVPEIGLLLGLYSIAQLVAAPAWGRRSDRHGRRSVLLIALLGTFVSTLLIALSNSAGLLFLAVFLNGASGGSTSVVQAALTDVTPREDRSRAMGYLGACIATGFVLGPLLASVSALGGARLPFYGATLLSGVNLIVAFARFPETASFARDLVDAARDRLPVRGPRSRLSVEQRLSIKQMFLAVGLMTASFGALETTLALVGRRHFGFGEAGAGLCFALMGVVMALTQASGAAAIGARLGPQRAVLGAGVVFSGGLVTIAVTHDVAFLCLGLVCCGVGYGIFSPLLTAAISNGAPDDRRGAVLGRQQAVASLARIVGPIVGALCLAGLGVTATYVLAALAVLVALVFAQRPLAERIRGDAMDVVPHLPSPGSGNMHSK